jgi:queuine tRNA-ribosyltransferase
LQPDISPHLRGILPAMPVHSDELPTRRGRLPLPAFLPDATFGTVRAADAGDVRAVGIRALVMNTFHLMQKPGSSTIQALGGLHAMAGWDGPIMTDSGGFQAYSLIRQNPKQGRLSDQGIVFQPEGAGRKFQLTPEKCIQLQLAYGADIVVCLDDCTHVDDPPTEQRASVRRTIQWAARCKQEFERQLAMRRMDNERPLLFAVVQGGGIAELRRECAEALLEIGFDGYGYGGWPLDSAGNLLTDMLALTRELIPAHLPLHALGVGHPEYVVTCARMGYQMFDSALPTRDARNGRLYTFATDPHTPEFRLVDRWFHYIYIQDGRYIKSTSPISPGCDCYTCTRYSLGYLHHLRAIGETLFYRLATIHNLRFMSILTDLLRAERKGRR